MNPELHAKLHARLSELGAIRKDLSFGCGVYTDKNGLFPLDSRFVVRDKTVYLRDYDRDISYGVILEFIGHPPILSDCLNGCKLAHIEKACSVGAVILATQWDCSKPHLSEQSDELGTKLLELLS